MGYGHLRLYIPHRSVSVTPTTAGSMATLTDTSSVFFGLLLFWKVFKRTKVVDPSEADIWTGKASIDAEVWPEPTAKTFYQKVSSEVG